MSYANPEEPPTFGQMLVVFCVMAVIYGFGVLFGVFILADIATAPETIPLPLVLLTVFCEGLVSYHFIKTMRIIFLLFEWRKEQ